MEGKILGSRYEIIKKIGGGGMAYVYKAKCSLLNRYVAIKVLKPEFIDDEEFVKRFRIEAQSAASLSHPNIVSIYDVGKEDNIHYIVMEYIDGTTLNEYIKNNERLEWKEAVRIAIQICSAIKHAHKNYIIHRDIKPQNIMITNDGIAKVTDFGIARAATTTTITMVGSTVGSVHYFSPEQARGGYTDEKSDIYSLGIVLYEMVTGHPPFDGEAPVAVALKHLQNTPVPPINKNRDVPSGLNALIMKAIEKDLNTRYQSASNLLAALYGILKNPDMAVTGSNMDKSSSPTRRMESIGTAELVGKEGFDISKRKKSQKKKRDRTILLALLVSVIIISAFVYFGYGLVMEGSGMGGKDKDTIKIGSYYGRNFFEVKKELEEKGVDAKPNYKYHDEKGKDIIINQDVEPGKTFIKGGMANIITFDVSMGEEKITIPNFKNEDTRRAQAELKNMDMDFVVRIEDENSDEVAQNHVIRTNPGEGVTVKRGAEIIVYNSKGVKLEYTVVPELIGLTYREAEEKIREANLKVGELVPDDEFSHIALIKEHYPQAGSEVEEEEPVKLIFDLESIVVKKPLLVELENPEQYGDEFKLIIEARMSDGSEHHLFNKTVRKNDLPVRVDIPVKYEGYTEVRVIAGIKLADTITVNYKD